MSSSQDRREDLPMTHLSLLHEFNQGLTAAKDVNSIFTTAMAFLGKTIGITSGLLCFVNKTKNEVVVEEVYGSGLQGLNGNRCKVDEGTGGEAIRRGCPVVIADVTKEPLLKGLDQQTQRSVDTLMCTPLRWAETVLGIMVTDNPRPSSKEDLILVDLVASSISPAVVAMRWSDEIPLDEILRRKLRRAIERMDLHTESHGSLMTDIISLVERTLILIALKKAGNIQMTAARFLGINRNTLHKKIKELGITLSRT